MGNILVPNWTWGKGDQENCNIYANYRRPANGFFGTDIINGYEGIPQNLAINIGGWLFLIGLFAVLRKKAWNYGRMAVMQKNEMKWADMFYGGGEGDENSLQYDEQGNQIDGTPLVRGIIRDTPVEAMSKVDQLQTPNPNQTTINFGESSSPRSSNINEIMDHGYFTWIKLTLKLTEQQYLEKCGQDSIRYLSFQKHLLCLAGIITTCSLGIVLPLNMLKSIEEMDTLDPIRNMTRKAEFSDTSIINLESRHNYLWAHLILSIIFLLISIGLMRRFSKQLRIEDGDSLESNHTVMIVGLNRKNCKDSILREHLCEIYPQAEITEISFAYDISKLQSIEFRRLGAASAKLYCEEKMEKTNRRPKIRPYHCGVVGCGCRRCKETDAIEYYAEIERKLKEEMDVERERAIEYPLGIAFVTFTTTECATAVVDDHAWSAKVCLHTPRSKHAKELSSRQWIVRQAPLPEDILWANLSLDYKMWYVKCLGINLVLLILVAVCTTPVWIFSLLSGPQNGTITPNPAASQLPFLAGVIVDTLPTMLICIIGVGLIALVSTSDTFVKYWTKTAGNLSEMLKIFVFLTFMVVVLPSLGVTSLSYIIHRQKLVRWSCIFYKENGVLFVNYVCTSTFVGTAAELLRLPELFVYAIKLGFARSAAELGSVRKSVLWDFQIGANYAWMLLHFAIFTCFSVIYPLVTPFGMAYLIMKHLVDRYNIYFVYAPCKVEKGVHATAVNLVMMCMFMLQINLMVYIHFHIGHQEDPMAAIKPDVRALQLVALIAFCVTTALFLGQMCFNACADFSPIHHFRSSLKKGQAKMDDQGIISQDDVREAEHTTSNDRVGNVMLMPLKVEEIPKDVPDIVVHSDLNIETDRPPRRVSIGSSAENSGSGGSSEKFVGRYIPPLLRPEFIKLHHINHHKSADDLPVPEENSKEGLSNSEGEDEILKPIEVKPPTHVQNKH